jgi:glycosyltransferase involved in cell wall biosynthesis
MRVEEPLTTPSDDLTGLTVCWVDTARYPQPLDAALAKKWQMLTELGVHILVTGFSTDLRPRYFEQYARFYLYPQWPIRLLRYLTVYLCAPPLVIWLIWRQGVQVLVAHDPNVGFAAALAKQFAGLFGRRVALVIESRGDFEEVLFTQRQITLKGLYRRLMRWTANYAFHHADVLRAISASTQAQLEHWAPGKPVVRFMSWTDASAFDIERAQPPSHSETILYAGVLVPGKGVHHLIRAFARLAEAYPQVRLRLIGRAENAAYAAELYEQVADAGLSDRVQFEPAMSQTELGAAMSSARVLVLPSLSEGLGRVLVEAMMTGTPVIGSTVGGIPDVIQDGVTGLLIPPDDVDVLEAALRRMLVDATVDGFSTPARQFAREYFNPAAYVQHYAQVFRLAQAALKQAKG